MSWRAYESQNIPIDEEEEEMSQANISWIDITSSSHLYQVSHSLLHLLWIENSD